MVYDYFIKGYFTPGVVFINVITLISRSVTNGLKKNLWNSD